MTGFVGWRTMQVHDKVKDILFPLFVMYPTQTPPQSMAFGPYPMEVSPQAPVHGRGLPLVMLSHGGGGTYLVYRTIAAHLAKNGYIVAMPEHAGNNVRDNALDGTAENLENRPRHLRLAMDTVFSDSQLMHHVRPDEAIVIGHSMGGYTALAVAGGQPWAGMGQKILVTPDTRVKALVLMAPATGWFVPNDSLQQLNVPILLLAAEHDRLTPRWQAQLVLDLVPRREQVTFKIVENAGHFSFLSPFHSSMKRKIFPPAMDPAGFDREKFHEQLHEELLVFLRRNFSGGQCQQERGTGNADAIDG